jgi:hypothetical protein
MSALRKTGSVGAAICALALVATVGSAIAGYTTGDNYAHASLSYQLGYAGGVADTLAALQSENLLKDGPFNEQTAKIARCLTDKKIKQSQVRAAYLTYLQTNPDKASQTAGTNIFEALKIACAK